MAAMALLLLIFFRIGENLWPLSNWVVLLRILVPTASVPNPGTSESFAVIKVIS